jgi:class 3 adenylate cyclase
MTDERRLVTVLFADVTGSTALGENLDPEDLRALLSRYYAVAKDVVGAHGGTVEKFIGDAVMAVFGLRQAHGDDAARAIAAALELRDRIRSDTRLGERLPIRLGVNTGDVVASRDESSDDFLVTGDAVNVAARLQQAANPWSILCGERTVRAVRGQFRFAETQTIEAKGKAGGVAGSEVIGRARTSDARTPLFGRAADLAQLELVAHRAFDEGRPYLVSVIAPPGTGKTRLLEEFLSRLPEIDANARVAVAQCLPYGQRLTYWPLRAVLFRIVGLADDAPADVVREAVGAWLRDAHVEDAAGVGALLASTVGAGDAEAVDRAALFAAWRTFVETAAGQAPLVVVVEDLHWSSDTLLDLFEFVLQPRTDTRAMMVALARPELLDRRPGWGGGRRNHVSIALEPLDDGAIAELVRHLTEGTPEGFVNAVVERAEGNPFFAGEIVAALLEVVKSFDDPVEVKAALARLPDTVQATVLARLDLLPDDEREVVRLGSVFGRSFRPSGVAALLPDADAESVAETCERLVDRDLVRPVGADGFVFRHILIREVAYATLPRAARARLHGAAGRWLEERAAGSEEAYAELVAYHYREAASLAGAMELDEADELRDKARTWLVKAAEMARAAAATIEARQHVREAVDFARPQDLPELYELLGDVEIGGSTIVDTYKKALDLATEAGRGPDMELRILGKMLTVETRSQGSVANRPTVDELNRVRDRGRQLFDRSHDPRSRATFLVAEAFVPFWTQATGRQSTEAELKSAEEAALDAFRIAQELDDPNLQSAALDALGSIAQQHGQWLRTLELGEQRIAMGTRLGVVEQIDALSVITWAATIVGDLTKAEAISRAGLAIIQPRQASDWAMHLIAWRAVVLGLLGKWDEVETAAERAYALWNETGRPAAGYSVRGFTAALIVARARRDEKRIAQWSEVIVEIGTQFALRRDQNISIATWDIGKLAASLTVDLIGTAAGRYDYVAAYLSICSDSAKVVDVNFLASLLEPVRAASARIMEANILRSQGLAKAEAAALDAANAIFRACGALPYAARTRCEAAILRGDRIELEAGLAYLESIRDQVQVERYLHAAARH